MDQMDLTTIPEWVEQVQIYLRTKAVYWLMRTVPTDTKEYMYHDSSSYSGFHQFTIEDVQRTQVANDWV